MVALREAIKKTADDVKLLIDELSVFEEIQEDKIAMIGVSMGGFVTYRAIVIDDRIKVGIPIISSPYWDDIPGDIYIVNDEKTKIELNSLSEKYQPSVHLDIFSNIDRKSNGEAIMPEIMDMMTSYICRKRSILHYIYTINYLYNTIDEKHELMLVNICADGRNH